MDSLRYAGDPAVEQKGPLFPLAKIGTIPADIHAFTIERYPEVRRAPTSRGFKEILSHNHAFFMQTLHVFLNLFKKKGFSVEKKKKKVTSPTVVHNHGCF